MNNLVSIIMPSYNTAQYIAETIQSVINQTYQNWELIIVDDCSTDNTDIVVGEIHDSRIRYIKNKKNSGAAISRNRALRLAKGRWVAFLDSDDLWKSEKLEKQIQFMKNNKCYFSYTNYEEIDADGNKTNVVVTGPKVISETGMFNYCWPGCLTVMYDQKKIGLIQIEDIKKNNDYAMWLKVCKKTRCYLLDEVLAEYRRGRTGSISTHGYKELIKWHYKLFRFAEKENAILSLINTSRNMLFGLYKKKKYVLCQNKEKKTNICIIGHFGFSKELLNGQTIKTKILTNELEKQFGASNVKKIDTYGGIKTLLKAPFQIFYALKNNKNVIILPAHNGLRVYAPILAVEQIFFKNRKMHYIVIGGWLPEFLKKHRIIQKSLYLFDGIYVETNTMKKALQKQGFSNVYLMPNCKELYILKEEELSYSFEKPYRLCTFSRVMKEKGIEDIVQAVEKVNSKTGEIVYSLDIYGPIDSNYESQFYKMEKEFPFYIKYCGTVPFDKSTEVLKGYFALVFPTRFYTEGIPGTIIDAFASGLPVISSKWESYGDLVDDGINGIGYTFKNNEELKNLLCKIAENPEFLMQMRENCIRKATDFTTKKVISDFIKRL